MRVVDTQVPRRQRTGVEPAVSGLERESGRPRDEPQSTWDGPAVRGHQRGHLASVGAGEAAWGPDLKSGRSSLGRRVLMAQHMLA